MEAINDKNNSESKNSFFLILFFALYCVLAGVSTELTLFYNAKEVTGEYIFLALGSAILSIVLGILFSLFFVKKKKFAIDKIFLIISALMFVGNTIALLSFPSSLTITDNFTFSSPFSFRMVLVISGLSTSVFIYNFYSFFCLLKQGKKSFSFIARVIVILTIGALVISYVIEFDEYVKFFNDGYFYIDSILGHKNIFGMLIVFGLMSEVYLLEQDKKWYHFLLLIYIFLSLFPVNSKSSILCGFILIIEYIFYCGFRFYKENKIISIICFGVFALCVIFAIIIFSIPTTNDTVFSNFISACKGLFDETEASGLTLRSRFALWGKVISQLNLSPMFWIFGYGNSNFNYSFYYAIDESSGIRISPTFHAHNGFVQCLATGGIFRLALYAALLAYLAYRFIKKYREKHDIHIFMSILFFFVFLGRTIVEPEYMLCDSIKGLVYIFFIIEPILSNEKETDNDFEWNFIPKLFCEYKTILLGALGAACLLFAGVYKGIYGYAIALPIGITTYGFFIYLSIKEKGNRNILYITSALLLIFLLSTSFSLSSDVSLVAPIFAAVFGLYLPFVSYLICQCFLNKEIINY